MIDKLIEQIRQPGGVKELPIIHGKVKSVLEFVNIMASTDTMETDENWWQIRLYLARN